MEETIKLSEHNPTWLREGGDEISRILRVLDPSLVIDIQHVGSTAIRGVSAKPIIDIVVLTTTLDEARDAIEPLTKMGYKHLADYPDKSGLYFAKSGDAGDSHHVVLIEDEEKYEDYILFRDYLKKYPFVAEEYEKLKTDLANSFRYDREGYNKGKADFITRIINKARA